MPDNKIGFTDPRALVRDMLEGDYPFRLDEKLVYYTSVLTHLVKILVPRGFLTDFYSVPWLLRRLISASGQALAPAILHDFLYRFNGFVQGLDLTRKQCDQIFLEAMLATGVARAKAYAIYAGVRAGGWVSWRQNGKALENFAQVNFDATYIQQCMEAERT